MTTMNTLLEHSLNIIAQDPSSQDIFGFERIRRAGSMFWEERFSVRLGHKQRLSRNRHFVDEGNIPIGIWKAPVEPSHVQQIAQALLDLKIWTLQGQPFRPEEDHVLLQVVYPGGLHRVSITHDFELKKLTYPLDSLLRRMITDLMASHQGAELLCQLTLHHDKNNLFGKITLLNQGNQDCLVPNPFILAQGRDDYLRLEMGTTPEHPEGLTDAGIKYQPLPLPSFDSLPTPWKSYFLPLRAGNTLEFPLDISIPSPTKPGYYVRAVYSCYSAPAELAGLLVIRGRAFSEEKELL